MKRNIITLILIVTVGVLCVFVDKYIQNNIKDTFSVFYFEDGISRTIQFENTSLNEVIQTQEEDGLQEYSVYRKVAL